MNSDHLNDRDLSAFTQQVQAEKARARRIEQIDREQTGAIRGEAKRRSKRKQQKAARKKNR